MSVVAELTACNSTQIDGWSASLDLAFARSGPRTVLEKSSHLGPLRVQRLLYPEGDLAHLYILHPPGGVVGGDRLDIKLALTQGARVLATTPGSGKFYLSAGQDAHFDQHLQVAAGTCLEWLPQENILFAGARLRATTRIELSGDAQFIGWDMTCFGRSASNERFTHGALHAQLAFYHEQELLLLENQRVVGERQLSASAGLRGESVQGIMLAFPCEQRHLDAIRATLASIATDPLMGATLIDSLLVIRALGSSSETLKQRLTAVWQTLRPMMSGLTATPPRIWAT